MLYSLLGRLRHMVTSRFRWARGQLALRARCGVNHHSDFHSSVVHHHRPHDARPSLAEEMYIFTSPL